MSVGTPTTCAPEAMTGALGADEDTVGAELQRPEDWTLMRVCAEPGCAALIPANRTRCPDCARAYERRRRAGSGRGSGGKAATFRRRVLAKSRGRCVICGSTDRVQADHIVALEDGGAPFDARNGQALCHAHHVEKTNQQRNGGSA